MRASPLTGPVTADELELSDGAWLQFVESCPDALPYHHPAWATVVAETYGFRTFALTLRDGSGAIVAGLPVVDVKAPFRPRRWVSLPYTDHLQPLARSEVAGARLVAALNERRRAAGVASAEVRAALGGADAHMLSEGFGHVLELGPDPDAVFRTFKRSRVQGAIQKGLRDGIEVRRGGEPADLTRVFYELHTLTRRRHGVPVQPRRLFELLWSRVVEPGLGFVLVAEAEGRPAAAAFFLGWNGTVIYKYSAGLPELGRLRPTNVLLWHAIRWACESGYRSFDFGRTDPENEGLRTFKQGWGTEERKLRYSALADRAPAAGTPSSPRALQAVIRRSPLFVTRLLGRLLYRYAA
ncbi:MAG TPA: GNAT family N-acetyltransferase [Gaiellaceae bacterium]|nr:GNAT family N-acetyltransferase [Gaiellaceae bacterium]